MQSVNVSTHHHHLHHHHDYHACHGMISVCSLCASFVCPLGELGKQAQGQDIFLYFPLLSTVHGVLLSI